MNKQSQRPNRQEIKTLNKERNAAHKALRAKQRTEGMNIPQKPSIPNRKSQYNNVEEEQAARQVAATEQARIFHSQLPGLLKTISKIKDLRNPKKIKHKLDLLMMYGILTFVFQMASRREANREITLPQFMESLKLLFPDIEDIPHNDTFKRVLAIAEVGLIEETLVEVVNRLIKKKKFERYLIQNDYPVGIDGSQKFCRDTIWSVECSEREVKDGNGAKMQYHVSVLEANLVFHNGMTIPLMSEFSNYEEGDTETAKQDCEQKAFKRLAVRLKKAFPRLEIILFLDGLYSNGPMIELIRENHWDFMIVLQSKSLPSMWEEFEGLRMVTCNETWEEIARDSTAVVTKKSRHAWISDKPFTRSNLHERFNLGARYRWGIEDKLLIVASDRMSAFDVVMDDPIPDKGSILTGISLFWFEKLAPMVENYLISASPAEYPEICRKYIEQLEHRSMHDENIDFETAVGLLGRDTAENVRSLSPQNL